MDVLAKSIFGLCIAGAFVAWVFAAIYLVRGLIASQADPGSRIMKWVAVFSWPVAKSYLNERAIHYAKRTKIAVVVFLVLVLVGIAAVGAGTYFQA